MHFFWWKWSIDSGDRACGPFLCIRRASPGCSGTLWAAPGRSGTLRAGPGCSRTLRAGPSRPLCAQNTPFVHKLSPPYQLCAPNDTFVRKLHSPPQLCAQNTPSVHKLLRRHPPVVRIPLSGIKVRVHSYSSCNSSATLPLATSTYRGPMCGRFNNFVELSTHTLVLRHSGRHECGRRIAGTCAALNMATKTGA